MADKAHSKEGREPDRALRKVDGLLSANQGHRLIHERVRLAIVSALAVNARLSFTELKQLLKITDGNLSVHARKLEEEGLVLCAKTFVNRQPKTEFRLSSKGRKVLEGYLAHMEALIRSVREG